MLERVLNAPGFRLHLIMFCVIITHIWWDIWNSYMAPGSFAFLWIFQKNCIDKISLKSQKRQRFIAFILVNTTQYPRSLKNNIDDSNKRGPPPLFHSDTNPVLGHVLIHSVDKTHVLVVTVELIWLLFLNILFFNFVPTPKKSLLGWQDSEGRMFSALLSFWLTKQVTLLFRLVSAALVKVATFLFFLAVCPQW